MFADGLSFTTSYDDKYITFLNGSFVTIHKVQNDGKSKPNGNKTLVFNRQPTDKDWYDAKHRNVQDAVDNLRDALLAAAE